MTGASGSEWLHWAATFRSLGQPEMAQLLRRIDEQLSSGEPSAELASECLKAAIFYDLQPKTRHLTTHLVSMLERAHHDLTASPDDSPSQQDDTDQTEQGDRQA